MHKPHIFIVEDEESLANTMGLNLRLENYQVTLARNGSEALALFNANYFALDLVLLDVMLPDISGLELCSAFKRLQPEMPVIFLTAKNHTSDKIAGLKLGADDYITKPFDLEELLLRINIILKRSQKDNSSVFTFGNCEINFQTYDITDVHGGQQTLSKREIGLLQMLTSSAGKVISRDEIIDALWDADENASSRTIDNYILNFRKLFETNPKNPQYFHSIRGVGYKFTA